MELKSQNGVIKDDLYFVHTFEWSFFKTAVKCFVVLYVLKFSILTMGSAYLKYGSVS